VTAPAGIESDSMRGPSTIARETPRLSSWTVSARTVISPLVQFSTNANVPTRIAASHHQRRRTVLRRRNQITRASKVTPSTSAIVTKKTK